MSTIAIIDYGMGNLHSIAKAMEHVSDAKIRVSDNAVDILAADRVILPGVGGIGHCMQALVSAGLDEVAREAARDKPMLGICIGMQMLFDHSEENDGTDCLGLVPGKVRRFDNPLIDKHTGNALKVPQMGWNQVTYQPHALWNGIEQNSRFYFVHSFYTTPDDASVIAATADYGGEFCCALSRDNLFAVQFHPEKSQHAGLALLKNFSTWDGQQE